MLRAFGSLLFVGIFASSAAADKRIELRVGPPQPILEHAALSGHTLYLNRCIGGCQIAPGDDDMTQTPIKSLAAPSNLTLAEATDVTEQEWQQIVQCVKEVYSPLNIKVTDQKPAAGTSYSGVVFSGTDADKSFPKFMTGSPGVTGGFAFVPGNCSANIRGVAYVFADNQTVNVFANDQGPTNTLSARVNSLCATIAQETAHSFGLDHSFEYVDDKASACNDPMSYETDCGGQRFFRNRAARCGVSGGIDGSEPGPRDCKCGFSQNTHLHLLNLFGEGTSLIPAPTAAITQPATSSTAANSLPGTIVASAGSKRGVGRVELFINGHKWAEVKGAAFGSLGQPDPSPYSIQIPAAVPDSIVDLQVKAYDDLELVGESAVITLVKGAAGGCTSAASCAEGQRCEAGKCFWDPPAGEVGDACTFPEFCKSGQCSDSTIQDDGVCTQPCVVGLADACPNGLECIAVGNGGICYTAADGGGCCSAGTETPWAPFVLGLGIFGFVVIRRRK